MDEADALTDLREPEGGRGRVFRLPTAPHTNSLVLQKCIIRPLEEKSTGGGKEARSLKKGTKTTKSDCIQGRINISFHQQRMPLVWIQQDTAAGATHFLFLLYDLINYVL